MMAEMECDKLEKERQTVGDGVQGGEGSCSNVMSFGDVDSVEREEDTEREVHDRISLSYYLLGGRQCSDHLVIWMEEEKEKEEKEREEEVEEERGKEVVGKKAMNLTKAGGRNKLPHNIIAGSHRCTGRRLW
jgi:hypothetical protein